MTDLQHDHNPSLCNHRGVRRAASLALLAGAFGAGIWFRDPMERLFGAKPAVNATGQPEPGKGTAEKQLWTCGMHPQVILDHPGVCPICHMTLTPLTAGPHMASHAGPLAAGTVMIDPVVVQRMGVRTATVESRKLTRVIRVVGSLTEPEQMHHDIALRVNGWIEKLYADVDGMAIKEGDPLFDLYSPEITLAVEELIAARKQREASSDSSTTGMYDAARSKLVRMGLGEAQIDGLAKLTTAPPTVPILSPMSGHITAKKVFGGSAVKEGDQVLRIADFSEMWAELQVYEQDLPYIHIGQMVTMTTPSDPDAKLEGEISFVHPHLDMMTRSAQVRVVIANAHHHLHEGMYIAGEIKATLPEDALLIPREAVIDTGSRQMAFLWKSGGAFEPRMLKLGVSDDDGSVQVLEGLSAGEKVVTSGQFLIDSESRLQEAVQKVMSDRLAIPSTDPAARGSK